MADSIKVRALRDGFYGNVIRKKGDVFDLVPIETMENGKKVMIDSETQIGTWMERVDDQEAKDLDEANKKSREEQMKLEQEQAKPKETKKPRGRPPKAAKAAEEGKPEEEKPTGDKEVIS